MTPIAIMQAMVITALMDSFTWFLLDRPVKALMRPEGRVN